MYWNLIVAAAMGCIAFFTARAKNRSIGTWTIFCALGGLVWPIGTAFLVLLITRRGLTLREKYLTLQLEDQLAKNMGLPSPLEESTEELILAILARNPQGLRIGALGHGVGKPWRSIEPIVDRLVQLGTIRRADELFFFNLE